MDPRLIAILSLRSAALVFASQGQTQIADDMTLLANAINAGVNVDAHMLRVAEALDSGNARTFAEVHEAIEADGERLQRFAAPTAVP